MPNILPLRVLIARGQPTLDGRIEATLRIRWPSAKFSYVATGPAVVDIAGHDHFDLLVVDNSGSTVADRDFVRDVRRVSRVPIVVLMGSTERLHHDAPNRHQPIDYLTAPFSPIELLARARAVMFEATRETNPLPASPDTAGRRQRWFDDGYLAVDFDRSRAWVDRVPVHLTPLELRLLAQLVGHGGNVVSNRALLAPILGKTNNDATDCLWIYVRRLREKIEPDPNVPRYVLTERGVGYRFARTVLSRRQRRVLMSDVDLAVLRRVPGRGAIVWRVIGGLERDRSTSCNTPAGRSAAGTEPSSRRRIRRTLPGASLVAVGTSGRP